MSMKATYASMQHQFELLGKRMEAERRRIAEIIAGIFVREDIAMKVGQYSDADLKGLMEMIAADVDKYIERFDSAKKSKQDAAVRAPKHGAKQDSTADAAASSAADGANHVSPDTGSVQAKANNVASDNRFVRH